MQDGIKLLCAVSGEHILLDQGKAKLIGQAYNAKRYLPDGTQVLQEVVRFHFGDERINDLFIWEEDRLAFHSISLYTASFIFSAYADLLREKKINPEHFIAVLTDVYTNKMMGF